MSSSRIILIIISGIIIIAIAAGWWLLQPDTNPPIYKNETTSSITDDTLTLQNLGGAELPADITFTKEFLRPGMETPIILFGQNLPKNQPSEPQRINPNFEIHGLESQIDIVASIDGVIGFVRQQDQSDDYEVFLQPKEKSDWTIGYDHVVDVTVKQGDVVKAGDVLGKAAPDQRFGYYYEIQVNEDNTPNGTIMHCPTNLLMADKQATVRAAFDQLVIDWTEWYGKTVFPKHTGGCVKNTLTAVESEGR